MGLYLGLRLALWAVAAIGPLIQIDICNIVTNRWTYHQPDNFGSRSSYRTIGIHSSDASVITKHHAWGYLDLLQTVTNLLLLWSASSWCYAGLMMCSIYINESTTCVDCCTAVMPFMYIFLKSWTICLTVWITNARCTILETTCLSGCA
jgi:hypothetical protein